SRDMTAKRDWSSDVCSSDLQRPNRTSVPRHATVPDANLDVAGFQHVRLGGCANVGHDGLQHRRGQAKLLFLVSGSGGRDLGKSDLQQFRLPNICATAESVTSLDSVPRSLRVHIPNQTSLFLAYR